MQNGEHPRSWGFWTEVKLDALERYLSRFTMASRRALSTLYLDLFAGSVNNVRRDDEGRHFFGSTVRALETEPRFTSLRFFELGLNADLLRSQLRDRYPDDGRFDVIDGDCNEELGSCLSSLRDDGLDRAPTFCFVDPDGLDVDWSTLRALAQFKNSSVRTKAEMLILLPHTSIPRLAGWDNAMGVDDTLSAKITSLYGSESWRAIDERRQGNDLTAAEARHLYLSLFRFKLERKLGYQKTLTIEMGNERGNPVYVLVFATDHEAGVRIMASVLEQAREQASSLRAEVGDKRRRRARESEGQYELFEPEELRGSLLPRSYETTRMDDEVVLPDWLLERIEGD